MPGRLLLGGEHVADQRDGPVVHPDLDRVRVAGVPPDDAPRLSNEVMVYLREQGGVRTGVDGRMRAM